MRIAFIILTGLHSLIHLFGFIKAFRPSNFSAINQVISKPLGLLWLLTFVLFTLTTLLYLIRAQYWWGYSLIALMISQTLIFNSWADAKFGTIINLMILLVTIIGYSNYNFNNKIKSERKTLYNNAESTEETIVLLEDILSLPPSIQKWLTNSGVIGKPKTTNLYLTQELLLKLKPEQTEWYKGTAEQYFTVQPPAFNWNINTKMNSILNVIGRDMYVDGKGEMIIKLLSIIPVVNTKNSAKIDQATLQRYLAEIVWFPSASLSPYIQWEYLNEYSALATMEYKGVKGSGVFHFDNEGNFKKFIAMRYRDTNKTAPEEWTITATKIEKRNGVKIPTECEASWKLENKKWTWLKLKITDIRYNLKEIPVVNC